MNHTHTSAIIARTIATAFAVAALALSVFAGTAFAEEGAPALLVATVPGGDTAATVSFAVPIPPLGTIKLTYNTKALSVSISGAITQRFKIYRKVLGGEPEALACTSSAFSKVLTFIGVSSGTATCEGVVAGDVLYFVREDFVPEFLETTGVAEEEEIISEEEEEAPAEEFALEGEPSFAEATEGEEEPSFLENVADFFGFGGEEEEEAPAEEFAFETGEGAGFETGELGEEVAVEEPSFFENVADFFGFGGEEEAVTEEVAEAPEEFAEVPAGEPSFAEATAGEPSFAEATAGEEEFAPALEEVFAEEGAAPVEEKLLSRIWREVRGFTRTVQNTVADVIIKLYVKPLPLAPEAAEPSSAEATAGEPSFAEATAGEPSFAEAPAGEGKALLDEGASIDESAEFIEAPTESDSVPAATVNQAFQNFINRLGQ